MPYQPNTNIYIRFQMIQHFCDSALKCEFLCNKSSCKRCLHDIRFHVPCSMFRCVSFLIFNEPDENGPANSENIILFSKKSHTNNVWCLFSARKLFNKKNNNNNKHVSHTRILNINCSFYSHAYCTQTNVK